MVANQGKITTLNDGISGTTGIIDGTDKMHSGILKALFAIASGSRVIECGDFTEDTTGSFTTYTLAADIIYTSLGSENTIRANQTVTMTAANASNTRHDLIYIDTDSTMKIKTGNDSATSIVPELDTGEVPVALIEVVGGSADDASHKVQLYLTEINFRDATLIRVKAASGATISKGQALYISGTHNANVAEVDLAMADSSSTMPCIGVAYSDLASGEEGFAVVLGKANGIAANFTAGDILYVSPTVAGGLTNTKPTSASHLIQNVGILFQAHASNASVKITGVGRTNDIPNTFSLSSITLDSADKVVIMDADNADKLSYVTAGDVGNLGKQNLQGVTDEGALTSSDIEAASFTKTGGTSAQFLKADGSVDSNTYITGYTETQDLQDVTDIDATTTNSITTGGLTNNGKQIFNIREVTASNFGVGFPIEYRSYYINEPSGGIVMEAGTEGQIINIKNINSVPLVLNFASNPIEQSNLSNDHRLTPSNIVTLQQWEGISLQYVNDGVTGPPSWYIVDTDETGGGGAEVNDLTASVTWANVPDANITESSVTQHREAIQDRVIVETGNDSPAASAAESGNYFYRASGETATFTIPADSYVGEYYVLMNNSGSAVTIASTGGDTLIGSTSISDGSAATVICVAANTWFVVG